MEVIALYSFTSNLADELSFLKGDKLLVINFYKNYIKIVKIIDPMDGIWYYAKNNNLEGFVPSNYIQINTKLLLFIY